MNDYKRRCRRGKEENAESAVSNSMKVLMISSILMLNESDENEENDGSFAELERPAPKAVTKSREIEKSKTVKRALVRNKPILRPKQKLFSRKF